MANCMKCKKELPQMPGKLPPKECRDRAACDRRAAVLPPPPPPAPCAPPIPTQEEAVKKIAESQRTLALRALDLSTNIVAKMEDQLQNGVAVTLRDGSVVTQPVQPMALATMLRELRPIVQEPVRVKEADEGITPPLQLNTRDPAVALAVVKALAEYRETKRLAAHSVIETEVISEVQNGD